MFNHQFKKEIDLIKKKIRKNVLEKIHSQKKLPLFENLSENELNILKEFWYTQGMITETLERVIKLEYVINQVIKQ